MGMSRFKARDSGKWRSSRLPRDSWFHTVCLFPDRSFKFSFSSFQKLELLLLQLVFPTSEMINEPWFIALVFTGSCSISATILCSTNPKLGCTLFSFKSLSMNLTLLLNKYSGLLRSLDLNYVLTWRAWLQCVEEKRRSSRSGILEWPHHLGVNDLRPSC